MPPPPHIIPIFKWWDFVLFFDCTDRYSTLFRGSALLHYHASILATCFQRKSLRKVSVPNCAKSNPIQFKWWRLKWSNGYRFLHYWAPWSVLKFRTDLLRQDSKKRNSNNGTIARRYRYIWKTISFIISFSSMRTREIDREGKCRVSVLSNNLLTPGGFFSRKKSVNFIASWQVLKLQKVQVTKSVYN